MKYFDTRLPDFVGQKVVDEEDKVFYCSGVGTLLYLTKHS